MMQKLLFWVGIPAALVAGISGAWAGLDYLGIRPVLSREIVPLEAQVASNSQSIALQRWQYLHAKRQNVGLDASEQAEYCALSRQLGFQGVGCR